MTAPTTQSKPPQIARFVYFNGTKFTTLELVLSAEHQLRGREFVERVYALVSRLALHYTAMQKCIRQRDHDGSTDAGRWNETNVSLRFYNAGVCELAELLSPTESAA